MMDKEMARALYAGRFFYKILKTEIPNELKLVGPFDNIRYLAKREEDPENDYEFAQIVDGKLASLFKKDEILVTMRKL